MRAARAAQHPAVVILAGRAVAQAGFFLFSVAPSFVLADDDYNHLIVGITTLLLAVVAPVGAFQQHLIRRPDAVDAQGDALRISVQLAIVCGVAGSALSSALVGFSTSTVLLCVGSIASLIPTLGASWHTLERRFVRSAALDGVSGVTFAVLAIVLVATDAPLVVWSVVYLAVWLVSAALTFVGPLHLPRPAVRAHIDHPLRVLRSGSTLIAIGVMSMAFNRADYLAMTTVASDAEATRYALAGRLVGPVLIALGSLNNSLFVRQLTLRDDEAELRRLTSSASRQVGTVALAAAPVVLGIVALLSAASDSADQRDLLLPSAILTLAVIPYAFAVPHAFSLIAEGRENRWLQILLGATIGNLVVVALVGSHGATATALAWLGTQVFVWAAVTALTSRRGRQRLAVRASADARSPDAR